jgi:hypothetical protein
MEGRWHLHSLADPDPCSHSLSRAPCSGKHLLLSALPFLLTSSQQPLLEIYIKIRMGVLIRGEFLQLGVGEVGVALCDRPHSKPELQQQVVGTYAAHTARARTYYCIHPLH